MFKKQEWILLLSLAFIQFSHIVDFMILMPLGPQLMRAFSISPKEFGVLVSVYTFAAGLSGLLSAFFIDKFDRKKSLLFMYCGFSVGTIMCALAESYSGLTTARLLTGAFGGVLSSLIMAIVSDCISADRRGAAMGIVMTAFSAASIFGVPFSLHLANNYDWHAPFTFLGSLSLFMVLVIMYLIPSVRGHLAEKIDAKSPLQTIAHFFTTKNSALALIFMSLVVLGQFSVIPFLSPSLVTNTGLLESQLPLVYLVGGIISIISSPLIGKLSDSHGKRKVFIAGASLSIVPLFIITHLNITPLPITLSVVALFFLCMGGRVVPANAIMTQTVHPANRGAFMSITASTQQFSAAIASFFAGLIITKSATGQIVNYQIVGYFAIAFTVLAIWISRKLKPVEGKY